MTWKPETYLQFAGRVPVRLPIFWPVSRTENPARDPIRVIDLGCGTGNSTALLAARWPRARLEGLDSSEAMLAEARAGEVPADWVPGDIARWQPKPPTT